MTKALIIIRYIGQVTDQGVDYSLSGQVTTQGVIISLTQCSSNCPARFDTGRNRTRKRKLGHRKGEAETNTLTAFIDNSNLWGVPSRFCLFWLFCLVCCLVFVVVSWMEQIRGWGEVGRGRGVGWGGGRWEGGGEWGGVCVCVWGGGGGGGDKNLRKIWSW